MTIITKTSDKKKLLPVPTAPLASPNSAVVANQTDEEAAVAYARHRARTATLLVCLLGVLVLVVGVFAGICFYRQYLRDKVQRINFYMPYEPEDLNSKDNLLLNSRWHDGPTNAESFMRRNNKNNNEVNDDDDDDDVDEQMYDDVIQTFFKQLMAQLNRDLEDPFKENRRLDDDSLRSRFFREDVEFKDDDDESFTDINIPDFRDGRQGRFIHDFKNNQTTIVDEEAKRCFVYPLDYSVTLPPKSMLDALIKMQTRYYLPDTNVLRKKMRVVTPELEKDDEYISERTRQICGYMRVYKLEPFVNGVFKRSITVNDDHAKFAEFSGRNIMEFDLVNFDEVLRYEEKLKN